MADDELDALLAEQRDYYRARAGEYDATYPLDEVAGAEARRQLVTALEALAPYGRVLELTCGTGEWTVELARHASAVTAVDSSPEALAICRRRVDAPHVSLVQADLFAWRPESATTSCSSRPGSRTSRSSASMPSGRSSRPAWHRAARCSCSTSCPRWPRSRILAPDQPAHTVRHRLTTGRSYRAVKVLHEPDDLRRRLAARAGRPTSAPSGGGSSSPPSAGPPGPACAETRRSRRERPSTAEFPDDRSPAPLEPALASIPEQMAQGFTSFCIKPSQFLDEPREFASWCRTVVRRVAALGGVTPASTATS